MNRDDIINMAREAGFEIGSVTGAIYAPVSCESELERFAALVAAAEREACAKVCDEYAKNSGNPMNFAENCVAAIRARGE